MKYQHHVIAICLCCCLYYLTFGQVHPLAFGIATSLGIGISECYGKSREPTTNVLNVYPNPCLNSATLDMPGRIPIHEVKCFDINGRLISVSIKQTDVDNKLYFNLRSGIYYLKINTAEKSFILRFIVLEK